MGKYANTWQLNIISFIVVLVVTFLGLYSLIDAVKNIFAA